MADRDRIGFLHGPAGPDGLPGAGPEDRSLLDRVPAALPAPYEAILVAEGTATENDPATGPKSLHHLSGRLDRMILGPLGRVQCALTWKRRPYAFSSYFHHSYARRAAELFRAQRAETIVFPLFPQWAAPLKKANPQARLMLWMPRHWLAVAPAAVEKHLERIDLILCGSGSIAERIGQRFGHLEDRLQVLPPGVDSLQWMPGASLSRHLLLYAGRITPERGIHLLLEAFDRIRHHYPDAQLVLAGAFQNTFFSQLHEAEPAQRRRWRRLGASYEYLVRREAQRLKGVFLTDAVEPMEMLRIYRNASIFVYPALWEEPAGTRVLEAMSCGLPVVASGAGACRDIVQDGRSGILVEPGAVDGLVEAIERLFDSRDLAQRMGAAGRTRVEERFDWKKIAERLVALITDQND